MTEDQLELEALDWLTGTGYTHLYGPHIAPDGPTPERNAFQQVLLADRLRNAIARLNPAVPASARDDALRLILNLDTPVLLSANRYFHTLLVNGVPVEYQLDGETRGDFVRLIDFTDVAGNEWLAVNQFAIKGPKHARRPDIILFVNGLPLVLLELKNPADLHADIWKAYDQIQTYKEQIPDVFQYNEILVISDGSEARMGSLSSNAERFLAWRTIDGDMLDPLGEFNELETLIRGILAPHYLLDYLRFFVLFEDDGGLVKKIAGYHQFHAVRAAIAQVVDASRPGGSHKGGVVWHTQGSGKSITMTCFAARVMRDTAMENPTHRRDHRPQRSRWPAVRGVFARTGPAARATGQGHDASGPARKTRGPSVRRDRVRDDPEVHARRGRRHVPGALGAEQHRSDRRRGAPNAVRF